jgi:hypothetical protein
VTAAGAWARPQTHAKGEAMAQLAAVLKARRWRRMVGAEATALPAAPSADHAYAWGDAVSHLRAVGLLVEDLGGETWGPGPGLEDIDTSGWPDGRAGFVLAASGRWAP